MTYLQDDTELTDSQVLSYLKKRRLKLVIELERLDLAIKSFEEPKLNVLDALAIDITMDEVEKDLETMPIYSPEMKDEAKVIYALSKLREANIVEIADFLMFSDTTLKHRGKVINRVSYTCRWLSNWGKIAVEMRVRTNYYKLKE